MEEITTNNGMSEKEIEKPIIEHLRELKKRLIYSVLALLLGFFIAYFFKIEIYKFLIKPLANLTAEGERKMIYTNLTEAFVTYIKLSIFAGFIFAFPVMAFQVYAFIAPALYKNEKKFFIPLLVSSPVLFVFGGAFVYYFLFPTAWDFFLSFETSATETLIPIKLEAKVADYLSLVTSLIIAFGLSFQLPIILLLLVFSGVLSLENLIKTRKYAVVVILIIAAILTPPDVISQIALFLPLYFLYEITILICKIYKK
jgi:sec-independent protein translocase protein TatC